MPEPSVVELCLVHVEMERPLVPEDQVALAALGGSAPARSRGPSGLAEAPVPSALAL